VHRLAAGAPDKSDMSDLSGMGIAGVFEKLFGGRAGDMHNRLYKIWKK